jgi:formylglycine-generating enzyme
MPQRERIFVLALIVSSACGGRIELEGLNPAAATNGGTTSTGGNATAGGNQATGCTGSLETIQSDTGLCVAKLATISGPFANSDFRIDVTEVTKGQYDAWLGTNPALPPSTDTSCGYVESYAQQGVEGVYTGPDSDHHPAVFVDWCDAHAYCSGVGKRLCGAIEGGSNDFWSYQDASKSQWFRACSSGGIYEYPYGNTYQASYCDGYDYWNDNHTQTVVVGSLPSCVTTDTGYSGIYDLSGNIFEWEDSCIGTSESAYCHIRGGAFNYNSSGLNCGVAGNYARVVVGYGIGFRCCFP